MEPVTNNNRKTEKPEKSNGKSTASFNGKITISHGDGGFKTAELIEKIISAHIKIAYLIVLKTAQHFWLASKSLHSRQTVMSLILYFFLEGT
jgi:hypothetical protein